MAGGPCGCGSNSVDIRGDLPITREGTGDPNNPYRIGFDCDHAIENCIVPHLGPGLTSQGTQIIPQLDTDPDNVLQLTTGGLFASPALSTGIEFGNTNTITTSGSGSTGNPIINDLKIASGLESDSNGVKPKVGTWGFSSNADTAGGGVYLDSTGRLRSDPPIRTNSAFIAAGITRAMGPYVTTGFEALPGGSYPNRLTLTNPDATRPMRAMIFAGTRLLISHTTGATTALQAQVRLSLTVGAITWVAQLAQINHGTSESIGEGVFPFQVIVIPAGGTIIVDAVIEGSSNTTTGWAGVTWNDPQIMAMGVSGT